MTMRVTFHSVRTQESTASDYKGSKAKILFSALVGCLGWMPLSSAAEAAPFQQYRNGVCSSSICTIDFREVPANRRLDITRVSCYLRTSRDRALYALQLLVVDVSGTPAAVTLVPKVTGDLQTISELVFTANHSIFAFANGGQRFRAYAELKKGAFKQFACHISGQLETVTPPED